MKCIIYYCYTFIEPYQCSIVVHFGSLNPFQVNWSTRSILVYSVHFDDVLGEEVCVERGAILLTIMSHSQCNVGRFLIKLHLFYVIKVLYFFFFNISDEFTYINI